jgi:hypothetical protein
MVDFPAPFSPMKLGHGGEDETIERLNGGKREWILVGLLDAFTRENDASDEWSIDSCALAAGHPTNLPGDSTEACGQGVPRPSRSARCSRGPAREPRSSVAPGYPLGISFMPISPRSRQPVCASHECARSTIGGPARAIDAADGRADGCHPSNHANDEHGS